MPASASIRPVVQRADELLADRGRTAAPGRRVTAHKLRHTFASILFVRGEDPPTVMAQLGHTDAAFTLRVYAHAMRRDDGAKERLKALVNGADWAPLGTGDPARATRHTHEPQTTKAPHMQGFRTMGAAGFEPATSRV